METIWWLDLGVVVITLLICMLLRGILTASCEPINLRERFLRESGRTQSLKAFVAIIGRASPLA
jgi:hypothetical protein